MNALYDLKHLLSPGETTKFLRMALLEYDGCGLRRYAQNGRKKGVTGAIARQLWLTCSSKAEKAHLQK